jgi:peptidoglycan/LPS O-acetylase OafA/YrhL/glycosyltransferase involved in cell wall biosynthesis
MRRSTQCPFGQTLPMPSKASFADNNFTVLRLGLALLVVLGHFKLLNGVHSPDWPYSYAATAVECFFVVSGYLITNSFDQDPDLKRFFIKRICRIYPLYIAVVLAQTIVLSSLLPGGLLGNIKSTLSYFAANAVFANFLRHDIAGELSGLADPSLNASLWTLKLEFAFYLLLPFVWRIVQRFGVAILFVLFFASVAYQEVMMQADLPVLAKQLPGQLQYFLLGVVAYRFRDRLTNNRYAGNRYAGLALGIGLAVLVTALMQPRPLILYPMAVAALVTVLALHTPRIGLTLDLSYGVYLLHAPVIQLSLLFGLYQAGFIGIAATLALVIPLAFVAERLVEAPGIAFGRRLIRRMRGRSSVVLQHSPDDRVTVVVLNDFCYVQGGASKVAIDEAIHLARSGVEVIFVGAVGPVCAELQAAPLTVSCFDQHELLDVTQHPSVALQGLWNGKAGRRVGEILRTLPTRHTIVHLHGYTKALTISPVRAALRLNVPVICTLHDFFVACPNGAFFDYRAVTPCLRRALSASCVLAHCDKRRYAHKLFRVARGLIQRTFGRFPGAVAHYITLSETSAAILAPYLPAGAQLHRLSNPIDTPRMKPVAVAENDTILHLGRLDEEKGVRLLAQVAAGLALPITFVGDGPLRAEIEAIPGVTVTGWLPAAEVRQHLTDVRCLVFPSLWYETFGLTVAEAASRGIPAIVSDISAAAERIEDGVTGWLFKSGDPIDLARCLSLIRDDRLVARAGKAAYDAFWADPPTADVHSAGLLRIYRATLASEFA